ncbi:MAG: lysophospholipid acyltransferase family protein [Planctomycetota bacterium]
MAEAPAEAPQKILVEKTLPYRIARNAVWLWLKLFHRLEVHGGENLPREGAVMIASNHQSFLDIPIIASATNRHVCFVARNTLAKFKPLAWLMAKCGTVLIGRGTADRAAMRLMGEHLSLGDCLAIFPEGTRSKDGTLGQFKGGAVVTARRAGVPIVPAGIRGPNRVLPSGAWLPRPVKIEIAFGEAIDPADPEAADKLRAAVASLIAR